MHKIKHAARRDAWYDNFQDTDNGRTYNFFGRVNARLKSPTDEENQLRQVESAPSFTENRNRSIDADPAHQYPHYNNTFPQGPEYAGQTLDGNAESALSHDRGIDPSAPSWEKSGEAEETEQPYQTSSMQGLDGPSNSHGRPRKRKRAFFSFGKKNHDQEEDSVDRVDTDKSKSSKKRRKIPFMAQFKAVFGSWINILLVFVPVGIALEYSGINEIVVFVINFIAIIPLAALLSFATEELAMYIGEVLGGLLNATFGNAVELIVSIIALTQGKVLIVQTSLIGSMLSNLLLVLGMCFFFGGINRSEQHFNITVAQTAASLLALAIGSLIIPTAFQIFANVDDGVTASSRGTSVLLLVVYACYLLFQLKTHTSMYNEPSQKTPKRSSGKKEAGDASKGIAMIGAASGAATVGGRVNQENLVHEQQPDEEDEPSLSIIGALVTLLISTVFIALCAEYMVSAISAVSEHVSQEFIGLILLPIVGNAAEHATAVTVAIKDKMDLSIGVAVGSSLQIALLVLPVMVLLSWFGVGANQGPVLNLDFDGFLVVVLVLSIWLVNYLINDGKSHWLEGVLLMVTYMIIAVNAWFYPAPGEVAG